MGGKCWQESEVTSCINYNWGSFILAVIQTLWWQIRLLKDLPDNLDDMSTYSTNITGMSTMRWLSICIITRLCKGCSLQIMRYQLIPTKVALSTKTLDILFQNKARYWRVQNHVSSFTPMLVGLWVKICIKKHFSMCFSKTIAQGIALFIASRINLRFW